MDNSIDTNLSVTTPQYDQGVMIPRDDDPLLKDPLKYQQLIGKLNYLSITRPDISYIILNLAQFMHFPKKSHWEATFRMIRYLKSYLGTRLCIPAYRGYQM